MITYHILRPSSMTRIGSEVVYNFAIRELQTDDTHFADGYRFVSHTESALPSENPALVLARVIAEHDSSIAINSFILNGVSVWIDKSTRVGLVNSINIEKAVGHDVSTLWFDGHKYVIPCDNALHLLSSIELYALECYNVTAQHTSRVSKLASDFISAQNEYSSLLYPQDGEPEPSASELQKSAESRSDILSAILDYDFTDGYPDRLVINI